MIDINLIDECRGGNFNNFRKLVRETSPFVFSVAFRMTGDEDQSKDIVQDTMVTIWQKLERIKSSETYKVWVYRIVVNKCFDYLRSRKRNKEIVADEEVWARLENMIVDRPASEIENGEIARIIGILACQLSPKQKAVFVLADLEEMTAEEIVEITGMSRSTIKANLHFARRNIAGKLEKYL